MNTTFPLSSSQAGTFSNAPNSSVSSSVSSAASAASSSSARTYGAERSSSAKALSSTTFIVSVEVASTLC